MLGSNPGPGSPHFLGSVVHPPIGSLKRQILVKNWETNVFNKATLGRLQIKKKKKPTAPESILIIIIWGLDLNRVPCAPSHTNKNWLNKCNENSSVKDKYCFNIDDKHED